MSRTNRIVLVTGLTMLSAACALTRSHVKSLRDHDTARIRFDDVIPTTVAALNALPPHCGPSADHRVRDEEFRVYQVVGRIRRVKREHDHDIHIVLEDPADPRARIVVESDDPDYDGNVTSPYRQKLAAARRMVDELVGPPGREQSPTIRGLAVRVTGVGFFDMKHFQIGGSRSCIELHPILAIERVGEVPRRTARATIATWAASALCGGAWVVLSAYPPASASTQSTRPVPEASPRSAPDRCGPSGRDT